MKIAYNSKGKLTRRTTNTVLDGPVDQIVEKLKQCGYANKKGSPTRNGRFINHPLYDMVEHYKMVERGILQYYKLANNYGRVAARTHYILKYSCALTIASKMKLTTLRRVFNKYGKNLSIKNELGETITDYPTTGYRRPKRFTIAPILDYSSLEAYIDQYDRRVQRGRRDLKGPCALCGSKKKIEIHHVRKLSKTKRCIRRQANSVIRLSNFNMSESRMQGNLHVRFGVDLLISNEIGMPRRIPDYPDAFYLFNKIASWGSYISAASFVFFFFVLAEAFYSSRQAVSNH
eukprot:scaffold24635_cov1547-Cylindrotheca_fusiformis.AAC.2